MKANSEGMTWSEWCAAAFGGRKLSYITNLLNVPATRIRSEWSKGVDPSDWRRAADAAEYDAGKPVDRDLALAHAHASLKADTPQHALAAYNALVAVVKRGGRYKLPSGRYTVQKATAVRFWQRAAEPMLAESVFVPGARCLVPEPGTSPQRMGAPGLGAVALLYRMSLVKLPVSPHQLSAVPLESSSTHTFTLVGPVQVIARELYDDGGVYVVPVTGDAAVTALRDFGVLP